MSKVINFGNVPSPGGFESLLGIDDASLRPIRNSLEDDTTEVLAKPQDYYDCSGWGLMTYPAPGGFAFGLVLYVKSESPSAGEAGSPRAVRRYRLAATAQYADKYGYCTSFGLFVLDEANVPPCVFQAASHVPKHSCLIYGASESAGFADLQVVEEETAGTLMERFSDQPILPFG